MNKHRKSLLTILCVWAALVETANTQSYLTEFAGTATFSGKSATVSFPQFNPEMGKLVGLRIQENLLLPYSYGLVNGTYPGRTNVVLTDWTWSFEDRGTETYLSFPLMPARILFYNQTPLPPITLHPWERVEGVFLYTGSGSIDRFQLILDDPLLIQATGTASFSFDVFVSAPNIPGFHNDYALSVYANYAAASTTLDLTYIYLVPEPNTLVLIGIGLASIVAFRRR